MHLIDTHCHLDDPRLDTERAKILENAVTAGIFAQVIPAVTAASWKRVRRLCNTQSNLYPCYGLHPMFLDQHNLQHIELLQDWLKTEPAVAVGECGLDYFKDTSQKETQKTLFRKQLEIATEFDLPAVVHANRAVEDVILLIRKSKLRRGVVHSFNGSRVQAQRLIDLGFKLSFGGAITFERATKIRNLVKQLPLEYLMIESDAPDQPPAKYNRELNQPAFLSEIFSTICSLRGESPHIIQTQLNQNASELFGISNTNSAL